MAGGYELFSLARTLIGFPPVLAFAATLNPAPTPDVLMSEIDALLSRYPLLSCCVPNPRVPRPTYERNLSLKAQDIVRLVSSAAPSTPELLGKHMEEANTFDVKTGPLWRVTLYQPSEGSKATLVMSLNHLLNDGLGTRNMFSEIISKVSSTSAVTGSQDDTTVALAAFPPTLEETVDVRPGWMQLFEVLFAEVLTPLLPSFLRPRTVPIWPNPPRYQPYIRPPRTVLMQIPAKNVASLKASGRTHGVRTLHPLLMAIAFHALWDANGRPATLHGSSCSPFSERDAALGHPPFTGNYVSSLTTVKDLSPAVGFWDLAQTLSGDLVSPGLRARARGNMGMLAYIPSAEKLVDGKAGWETFFERQLTSDAPFGTSIELSNLGVMDVEEGVSEVAWAQAPYPCSSLLLLNVRPYSLMPIITKFANDGERS
jgi:hypothetical protein